MAEKSELDETLDRLEEAVSGLVKASRRGQAEQAATEGRISELEAERDRLRAELEELRAARRQDEQLREEAAEAVKVALGDLRAVLAAQERDTRQEVRQGGSSA